MALDLQRIVEAAAAAAFEDSGDRKQDQRGGKTTKRRSLAPRAFLVGAGLMTAGRLLARGRRSGGLLPELKERLIEFEDRYLGDGEGQAEEPTVEDDWDEEDVDEGPEGEYDEDDDEGAFEDEDEEEDEDELEDERAPSGSSSRSSGR